MPTQDKQAKNNLTRNGNPAWKKGVSGNPKGRPKKADCLINCLKDELERKGSDGLTNEQHIAAILVIKAMQGDMTAIKLAFEYTAGKPAQAISVSGDDGGPVRIVVEYAHVQG
jgi:hypothetical protein